MAGARAGRGGAGRGSKKPDTVPKPERRPAGKTRGLSDPARWAEILAKPASALMQYTGTSSSGVEDDLYEEAGDCPEGVDFTQEYGHDPTFDDRDPAQLAEGRNFFDDRDAAAADAWTHQRHQPDLIFRERKAGSWEVQVVRVIPYAEGPSEEEIAVDGERRIRRDRKLQLLGEAIARRQAKYLESLDPSDLKAFTAAEIERNTDLKGDDLSRLMDAKFLELPDGQVVPLRDLMPDRNYERARFIENLIRNEDRVIRHRDGRVEVEYLVPIGSIVLALQKKFGPSGNGKRTVYQLMKSLNLPTEKARRRWYLEGRDHWQFS